MRVDNVAMDEVPRLFDRLTVADGMGEVPDHADAGVVGKVEHMPDPLAGREGVVGFEGQADAIRVGRDGNFAQRLGDPSR